MSKNCYCGNVKPFAECCEIFIKEIEKAPTAEKLMRSRYSAYATHAVDYLVNTTHVSKRKYHSKEDILIWSKSNQWIKLEILNSSENTVEFKAYYIDSDLKAQVHHEKSGFKNDNGLWFYVDGEFY
ncbi:YchJ family protein [Flavobacterium qiangtangense]|uniref:YchJ family protein n=1 Tax=Flavobacterium qiangtangense TaxID=1442595 RepID=A0ABW1PKG6_9FLAO